MAIIFYLCVYVCEEQPALAVELSIRFTGLGNLLHLYLPLLLSSTESSEVGVDGWVKQGKFTLKSALNIPNET